jgi:hypothetical protein
VRASAGSRVKSVLPSLFPFSPSHHSQSSAYRGKGATKGAEKRKFELTDEQKQEIREAFDLFDTDGSGALKGVPQKWEENDVGSSGVRAPGAPGGGPGRVRRRAAGARCSHPDLRAEGVAVRLLPGRERSLRASRNGRDDASVGPRVWGGGQLLSRAKKRPALRCSSANAHTALGGFSTAR